MKRLAAAPVLDSGVKAKRLPAKIESKTAVGSRSETSVPVNPVRMNWNKVGGHSQSSTQQASTATIGRIVTRTSGGK